MNHGGAHSLHGVPSALGRFLRANYSANAAHECV
jgi:hypothetical protein